MSTESMLDRLDKYYHEQGIPAIGFNCKHRDACSAVCAPYQMVSVPESYVGPGYEEGKLPRLLFVSSDTNSADWQKGNPEYGALRCIRESTLRVLRIAPSKNKHWKQTLLFAERLLVPFAMNCLGRGIPKTEVVEYIAHTRSTRCKDNSIGTEEGNPQMAVNCREYLKGEIETLQPDIIVTQGARARNAMAWKFGTNHRVVMPGNPRHRAFHESVEMPMNLRAMKIVGWHPCAHWRRGEEEQFMDWAIESVQKVIPPAEWTRRHNVQETAPNV